RATLVPTGCWMIRGGVGATFRTKVLRPRAPEASLTRTVISALPYWLGAGVMARVRLAPLPPGIRPELGTSTGFAESAVTTRFAAGVSTSPTVNGMAGIELFARMFWSGMDEMVGGVLLSSGVEAWKETGSGLALLPLRSRT